MKLNISYPSTGLQKAIVVDDEKKLAILFDKRLSQEISGDFLGEEFKGYVFRITGGHDKQGFTMKQGVLADHRVRLLLKGGPCYRPRRSGERRRKSVRGCIISHDIAALAMVVVKKGEKDVEGLTDGTKPRRLGPKRASRIRKLFALSKKDDVRKYVIRREITVKDDSKRKKPKTKAPKIQRLVTPVTLARKRHLRALRIKRMRKSQALASAYQKLIAKRKLEAARKSRATRLHSRLRSASASERASKASKTSDKDTASKKVEQKAAAPADKKDKKDTKTKDVKKDTTAKDTKTKDTKSKDTKKAASTPAPVAAPAKAAEAKKEDKKDAGKKDAKKGKEAEKPKAAPTPAPAAEPKKEAPKAAAPKPKADKPAEKKPAGDKAKKGGK